MGGGLGTGEHLGQGWGREGADGQLGRGWRERGVTVEKWAIKQEGEGKRGCKEGAISQ